jgi:hypothetical protein
MVQSSHPEDLELVLLEVRYVHLVSTLHPDISASLRSVISVSQQHTMSKAKANFLGGLDFDVPDLI